jgi:hypothetical protein
MCARDQVKASTAPLRLASAICPCSGGLVSRTKESSDRHVSDLAPRRHSPLGTVRPKQSVDRSQRGPHTSRLVLRVLAVLGLWLFRGTAGYSGVFFTEIMYNPSGSDGFLIRGQNTEWLELFNPSPRATSLAGWVIERLLPSGTIRRLGSFGPGAFVPGWGIAVVIPGAGLATVADYRHAWDIDPSVAIWPLEGWGPTLAFGLPNTGAVIQLRDPTGSVADRLDYGAPGFPPSRNGRSIELTVFQPFRGSIDNDVGSHWRHGVRPIPNPGPATGNVRFGANDFGSPGIVPVSSVCEPATMTLWLLGAGSWAVSSWRRRRQVTPNG